MTAKFYLFLILAFCSSTEGNAQVVYSLNPPNASRSAQAQFVRNLTQRLDPDDVKIEGSPYLNEDFVKGHIYSNRGNFNDVEMRYNIYYVFMEFKEKGQLYALVPNILVNKIQLDSLTFVVDFYEHKGVSTPMYAVRLDSGRVSLMSKKRILFRDQQPGKPIEGDIPASYKQLPDVYYVKVGNGPLLEVRSMKKLIAALPDKQKELEEFAKKEKISPNKPEELTRFIQYYNSLE